MKRFRNRRRTRRRGSLTFEWIIISTIMGISLVAALAVVRNGLIAEFGELIDTICNIDVCE